MDLEKRLKLGDGCKIVINHHHGCVHIDHDNDCDDQNGGNSGGTNADSISMYDFHAWTTPCIASTGKRTLVIKEGTIIRLVADGVSRWRRQATDEVLDVVSLLDQGVLSNGKDYYIYLVPDGESGTKFVISLDSTYPSGYAASNSRKVGGFHTLCVDVETIVDHPLSDYIAGDILPASVWCLNHRPYSQPEGMVYEPTQNIWVDIYLQSGTGADAKSVYGATVTEMRQYVDHVEDMFRVNKALLNDEEFAAAMEGSNQQTSIAGAAAPNPKTTGGHKDSAGRRMISNIGCEEGCGYMWQWLATTSAGGMDGIIGGQITTIPTYGSITITSSIGNEQAGDKGMFQGLAGAVLAGGSWINHVACGSRCRSGLNSRSNAHDRTNARGRSLPRNFI